MIDQSLKPHAVVLGSSGSVGLACARKLSKSHNVSCLSRRGINFNVEEFEGVSIFCDVLKSESIKLAFEESISRFGKISTLVFCVGLQLIKPARLLKDDDIQSVIETNFSSLVKVSSLFASQRFSDVNAVMCVVSSVAAKSPEPGIVLYSASKAAVEALVVGLAKELAPKRVVGVAPGWMDTDMTRAYPYIYNEEYIEELKKKSPLGLVTVDDVANAIVHLTSTKAVKITGQIITIDGGASLY
jgi:NAD(P)-dependent dehydrogenase (short-subunit alcohol dehydrogenase family)